MLFSCGKFQPRIEPDIASELVDIERVNEVKKDVAISPAGNGASRGVESGQYVMSLSDGINDIDIVISGANEVMSNHDDTSRKPVESN